MWRYNPIIHNYKCDKGDPAVLVVVCTTRGTSAQIVECGDQTVECFFVCSSRFGAVGPSFRVFLLLCFGEEHETWNVCEQSYAAMTHTNTNKRLPAVVYGLVWQLAPLLCRTLSQRCLFVNRSAFPFFASLPSSLTPRSHTKQLTVGIQQFRNEKWIHPWENLEPQLGDGKEC